VGQEIVPADTTQQGVKLRSRLSQELRYSGTGAEGSAEYDLWRTPVHHGDRAIRHNTMWAPNLAFGDIDVETEVLKRGRVG